MGVGVRYILHYEPLWSTWVHTAREKGTQIETLVSGLAGHSCKQHISRAQCAPGLAQSGEARAFFPTPSEKVATASAALTDPPPRARARIPRPQEAEGQPRSSCLSARSRSPRFCPRSTAYGRLCSGGSTGLGASTCPTRRLHRPKHSPQHNTYSIFPNQRRRESTSAGSPTPVSTCVQPSVTASTGCVSAVARVTVVPPPSKLPSPRTFSEVTILCRILFTSVTVPLHPTFLLLAPRPLFLEVSRKFFTNLCVLILNLLYKPLKQTLYYHFTDAAFAGGPYLDLLF